MGNLENPLLKEQVGDIKVESNQILNYENPKYFESYFDDVIGVDEEHRITKFSKKPQSKSSMKKLMEFSNNFNYEGIDEESRFPSKPKAFIKYDNTSA